MTEIKWWEPEWSYANDYPYDGDFSWFHDECPMHPEGYVEEERDKGRHLIALLCDCGAILQVPHRAARPKERRTIPVSEDVYDLARRGS